MTHRGKRSQQGITKQATRFCEYTERQQKRDIANYITLTYSLHDPFNGDIVWHPETESVILDKLRAKFDCVPMHAVNHEYGDVLNRFGR